MNTKKYDVAFSFAGEDRKYVNEVAKVLRSRGVEVFYDDYEKVELWGKNLYDHLSVIYESASKFVVMFISKHYAEKVWTNHERKSAQARAFKEKFEYILPARFDNTEIPGLLSTVGYVNLNKYEPKEFAYLIEKKLGHRSAYWQSEADRASKFSDRILSEAHRGAFSWNYGVTAIFDNRVADPEEKFLKDFVGGLDKDKVLARGEPHRRCRWILLYDSPNVKELHELIWECVAKYYFKDAYGKIVFNAQYEIATDTINYRVMTPAKLMFE